MCSRWPSLVVEAAAHVAEHSSVPSVVGFSPGSDNLLDVSQCSSHPFIRSEENQRAKLLLVFVTMISYRLSHLLPFYCPFNIIFYLNAIIGFT